MHSITNLKGIREKYALHIFYVFLIHFLQQQNLRIIFLKFGLFSKLEKPNKISTKLLRFRFSKTLLS